MRNGRRRSTGFTKSRRALGILALAFLLGGCGAPPSVPRSLGGLPLAYALQGKEALQEINRLHGKGILAREGFVAHYQRGDRKAMLYVSSAYLGLIARRQVEKMVGSIEQGQASGKGKFFHLKGREKSGLTLYSTLGFGQIHYFYRSGPTVVWLAADPAVGQAALDDALRLVR